MAKTNTWYATYPADFEIDTATLTLEEVGAYKRLLNHYWRRQGPLPDDDAELSRLVNTPINDWLRIRERLLFLFKLRNGKVHIPWMDAELAKAQHNSKVKRQNANKRWQKQADANAMQKDMQTGMQNGCPSPTPSPSPEDLPGEDSVEPLYVVLGAGAEK